MGTVEVKEPEHLEAVVATIAYSEKPLTIDGIAYNSNNIKKIPAMKVIDFIDTWMPDLISKTEETDDDPIYYNFKQKASPEVLVEWIRKAAGIQTAKTPSQVAKFRGIKAIKALKDLGGHASAAELANLIGSSVSPMFDLYRYFRDKKLLGYFEVDNSGRADKYKWKEANTITPEELAELAYRKYKDIAKEEEVAPIVKIDEDILLKALQERPKTLKELAEELGEENSARVYSRMRSMERGMAIEFIRDTKTKTYFYKKEEGVIKKHIDPETPRVPGQNLRAIKMAKGFYATRAIEKAMEKLHAIMELECTRYAPVYPGSQDLTILEFDKKDEEKIVFDVKRQLARPLIDEILNSGITGDPVITDEGVMALTFEVGRVEIRLGLHNRHSLVVHKR